ncbi:MAG: glutaredoxin [Candidatus Moraniibacteriota bacterium]
MFFLKKNKNIQNKILFFLLIAISATLTFFIFNQDRGGETEDIQIEGEKHIIVFVREGCGACAKEEAFLSKIKNKNVKPEFLDIGEGENYQKFLAVVEKYELTKVTPITLAGGKALIGFDSAESTGQEILSIADSKYNSLEKYLNQNEKFESTDSDSSGFCAVTGAEACSQDEIQKDTLEKIKIPFWGVTETKDFSLFSLATILGFIDGFNPCAMWVLVAFLIALSQVGSQSKMIFVAGIFIVAEAVMYFLILNVWYLTWDFIKLDKLVLPLIGLLSLGAGIYFLYKFRKNKGQLVCDVTSIEHQRKTTTRIKDIATNPLSILVTFVIIGLAFSVNIIEFACSIGLAQSFTKILEINSVSFWMQQFYIGIYTLFYMVDDFIVFGLAIFGYRKFYQFGAKYSNLALLIGGILLIIIGVLMLSGKNIFVF